MAGKDTGNERVGGRCTRWEHVTVCDVYLGSRILIKGGVDHFVRVSPTNERGDTAEIHGRERGREGGRSARGEEIPTIL